MGSASSDSEDDEWGAAELDLRSSSDSQKQHTASFLEQNEEFWNEEPKKKTGIVEDTTKVEPSTQQQQQQVVSSSRPGEPMILVNLTKLSQQEIHCRFDKNSVNDSQAVSKWRRTIEESYSDYAKNTELLANGTVVPCGSSVWRPALVKLRNENPGHYFVPIFPKR